MGRCSVKCSLPPSILYSLHHTEVHTSYRHLNFPAQSFKLLLNEVSSRDNLGGAINNPPLGPVPSTGPRRPLCNVGILVVGTASHSEDDGFREPLSPLSEAGPGPRTLDAQTARQSARRGAASGSYRGRRRHGTTRVSIPRIEVQEVFCSLDRRGRSRAWIHDALHNFGAA